MIARPILFSGPMVRALLAGTKTQTRRIVKPQPVPTDQLGDEEYNGPRQTFVEDGALRSPSRHGSLVVPSPYGGPGERLWVRERFSPHQSDSRKYVVFADGSQKYDDGIYCPGLKEYAAGAFDHIKWKPSIHMPRWASRITLGITGVRVERLQAITAADAVAEGIDDTWRANLWPLTWDHGPHEFLPAGVKPDWATPDQRAVAWYAALWAGINGKESWDANPWVWVVVFKRLIKVAA